MVNHEAIQLACRARATTLVVAQADGDFSRASTATYVNASGVVTTAAVDEARTAHYVAGVGPAALYEAAATNLCLRSQEFDNATWANVGSPSVTANSTTAPDGTLTADTLTDASAVEGRGKRQTFTIADDATVRWASVYIAKTVGTPVHFPCMNIRLTGGTIVDRYIVVNTTTGAFFASSGTGAVESVGDYWRVSTRATNNASGNTTALLSVYPAWRGDILASDLDVTTTGSNVFWGAQLEVGTAATSYIPTTTATVTRAADLGGMAATGSTYTRTVGSFVTDGLRIGMEVLPAGFSDTTRRVVTDVAALTLAVNGTPTAQTIAGGRTLTVGLPSTVAYENVVTAPVAGVPYVVEQYLPNCTRKFTVAALGSLEVLALYVLQFYARMGSDMPALAKYADATIAHFAPNTSMALSTGDVAVVRNSPAPDRSQLTNPDSGWAMVSVTIPVRCITANIA